MHLIYCIAQKECDYDCGMACFHVKLLECEFRAHLRQPFLCTLLHDLPCNFLPRVQRRVQPEDVTINVSKNAHVPEPPPGHKWKQVQHDSKVTWLASWTENIQGQIKYIMLNPTSRLKVGGQGRAGCFLYIVCSYHIHVQDCVLGS